MLARINKREATVLSCRKNHGYEPQSKFWKQIPQQAAGY